MTFSPFYMGNDVEPQTEDGYVINENWGLTVLALAMLGDNRAKSRINFFMLLLLVF